jgi:PAS domain S-box-containing protein
VSFRNLEEMPKEELIRELRKLQTVERLESRPAGAEPERLIHELQVHQVELEMQNRELREAQVVIEESRRRYADLYDFAPVGYCTLDPGGRIEEINLTGAALLGVVREQLLGRFFAVVAPLSDKLSFQSHLQLCQGEQSRVTSELTLSLKRRGSVVVQMVSVPSKDSSGRVLGYRTMLSDISALKSMETRLRFLAEMGERLASSLDYASTVAAAASFSVPFFADLCFVDVRDEEGQIRRLDVAFEDARRRAAFGERIKHHMPRPGKQSPQAAVIASGEPLFLPEPPSPGAGAPAQAESYAEMMRALGIRSLIVVPLSARGQVYGALSLAATAIDRRYTEADLVFAEEIGHRAAIAIDNARLHEQAQRAIAARESLLALVSHDLRTPLGVIFMKTEVLLRLPAMMDEVTAQGRKAVDAIRRSSERMSRLISDLLDIASIEAGRFAIERRAQPVRPLVSEALETFEEMAAGKSLRLVSELPPGDGLGVVCDRERILQVLSNLIGNAIKFTGAGGTITVRAEPGAGEARFSIADTGSGIPHEDLSHIFDRFWQVQKTARLGTGLGLSIARGIVEAHGGLLWVQSQLGLGSTFFFTLPLASSLSAPPDRSRSAGPPPIADSSTAPGAAARRDVVLVVDDDTDVREALGEALQQEGYEVAAAANGAAALEYLRSHPAPSLVLLDLSMPVMDGWGFLTERNQDPDLRSIPVIVVSGQRDVEAQVLAAHAGYAAKPLRTDKLLKLMRRQ